MRQSKQINESHHLLGLTLRGIVDVSFQSMPCLPINALADTRGVATQMGGNSDGLYKPQNPKSFCYLEVSTHKKSPALRARNTPRKISRRSAPEIPLRILRISNTPAARISFCCLCTPLARYTFSMIFANSVAYTHPKRCCLYTGGGRYRGTVRTQSRFLGPRCISLAAPFLWE